MSLKYRKIWLFLGYCLVIAIITLSLVRFPADTPPLVSDKIKHAFAYAVLMGWFIQLYNKLHWRHLALIFFLFGFALELAQGATSYRYFDLLDLIANTCGIIFAWLLCVKAPLFSQILKRLEHLFASK